MEKLKNGDQVRLKSGGPEMVVNNIHPMNGYGYIECVYFTNSDCKTVYITEDALIKINTAIDLVIKERDRQIKDKGWTFEDDDKRTNNELANAAALYALDEAYRTQCMHIWPFEKIWFKPNLTNRKRDLEKAGALILAEIERLNRINDK